MKRRLKVRKGKAERTTAGNMAGGSTGNGLPIAYRPRELRADLAVCLFMAIAVGIAFGPTLAHQFVTYDDDDYVYNNAVVRGGLNLPSAAWAFTHVVSGNWHPVTVLSHMVDCTIYGLNPWGHHLTNVGLHIVVVCGLFLLLRKMTGALWRSAFVASVFAVHPLRVESVAWVSERKDLLSGVFFVLTLWAYYRYVKARRETRDNREPKAESSGMLKPGSRPYLLSLMFFALGLMSKPMLVTLPFVLLLLDFWPLERLDIPASPQTMARLLREKIPFFLLSAAACVWTLAVQRDSMQLTQFYGFWTRLANAIVAYVVYLGQLFYPSGLAVLYPHPGNKLPSWEIALSLLLLILVTVLVTIAGRRYRWLAVGWFWYLGMLVPVIGIIQVGAQARADRYTYLPQIGLYIMLAWAAVDLSGAGWYRRTFLAAAAAASVGALMWPARVQTSYWKDGTSLWTRCTLCTADNFIAHNNLGTTLYQKGELQEAIRHFQRALEINRDFALARNGLALSLSASGQSEDAVREYERILQMDPNDADAHSELAGLLSGKGQFDQAIRHYEQALQIRPDFAKAHNGLGVVFSRRGMPADAQRHYEAALRIKPDYADAYDNLGLLYSSQGKAEQAVQAYRQALEADPACLAAYLNLGVAFAAQGKLDEALKSYEQALRLNPNDAKAHFNIGIALVSQKNPGEAINHFEQAVRLQPDYLKARVSLGDTLNSQGKPEEAAAQFQQALVLAESQKDLPLAISIRVRLANCQSGLTSPRNRSQNSKR